MAETPILRIPQVSPSQSNKETTINDGFAIMERSLNDNRGIDLSAGDVEVNVQDYTRAFLFRCFGHTVARELTVPASTRFFTVFNDGTANVTVKAKDSAGMTAVCPQGSYCVIFNDGTDIILISDSAASGQVSAFLSLPDTPATFAGQGGQAVVVNGAEDGLEFGTIAVSFTQLTDTPANYSGGQAGRVVRVNAGATGLEFANYITQFAQLSDTPSDYVSQAGRMMVVNPNENGLMFTDVPEPVIMATRVFDIPNGAFEEQDFTHWIIPTTSFPEWVVITGYFSLEAVAGTHFAVFATEQGTDPNTIAYELDLLDVAYAEEIDDEAEIVVDISMGSMTEDYGSIEVEFLDESDQFIGGDTSPQYVGTTEMTDRRFRTEIPEGARKVIVYLHIENNTDGVDPDNLSFAFDNLRVELKLVVDQISNLIQLFDTPLSYEGNAGKVLVVNGEENAMEFQDTPGVRDYFYQLLDTPANYDGAVGRYVRVNGAGDGLVFEVPQFTQLGDTPANFGGQSGRYLRVNTGETALEFVPDTGGVETLEDLDDVAYPDAPEDGWVLTYDDGMWIAAAPSGGGGPGGGAEVLEDLDDVAFPDPPQDGWVLTYDDGMWIAAEPTGGGGGSAEYPDFTGNAGRVLAVNSGEDDVEWVVQSGGISVSAFGVSFSSTGTPDSEQIVWTFLSPGFWNLPEDFGDSIFFAGVAPSDEVVFDITKNGTLIGTATFGISENFAVFDVAGTTSFVLGDRLQFVAPANLENIADLSATLIGLAGA